jgi:hypothetical protein
MNSMDVKRVHLRTEHGYDFAVKLFNAENYSYFECSNWRALCKAYAFEQNMLMTFDIHPEDEIEGNIDIWVDVHMPLIRPFCIIFTYCYLQCFNA